MSGRRQLGGAEPTAQRSGGTAPEQTGTRDGDAVPCDAVAASAERGKPLGSPRRIPLSMVGLVLLADGIQFLLLLAMKKLAPLLASASLSDPAALAGLAPALLASPFLWLALAAMAASFVVWMTVLANLDLSIAFPLGSVSFLLVPLLSALVLGEQVPPLRWAGFAVVAIGIVALAQDPRACKEGA